MTNATIGFLVATVLGGLPAFAQNPPPIQDNFESYADGSGIAGQGPWDAWDGNLAADSFVSTDQARSGTKSLEIVGPSDTIINTKLIENGCFIVRTKQFIPSSFTGTTYWLLLNTYQHGGPYHWSAQLEFEGATGQINDGDPTSPLRAFVKNRWAEVGMKIDLFADTATAFYDGNVLYTDVWSTHLNTGGTASLEALDLYANGATSVYYDDIEIVTCLNLVGPDPGFPGQDNDFQVTGANPNATVTVLYGTQSGRKDIPGCPGSVLPFTNPGLIGTGTANGQGALTITKTIPLNASGKTAQFIAVERDTCRVSNANEHTFP